MGDFWVFGYGSLMWNPGFSHDEMQLACLYGYHRSLCIHSYHHRGTKQNPGLVLGLDRGGSCLGMAFHVQKQHAAKTYEYLIEREQVSGVYVEKHLEVRLENGQKMMALAFVTNRQHEQYAGKMGLSEMADIVAKSSGLSGPNRDYVTNTVALLQKLGIHDGALEHIAHSLT